MRPRSKSSRRHPRSSGAASIPAFLRISHAVDAATFTPRPASSPWILRTPQPGFFAGQPEDQAPDVPARSRPTCPAAHGPRRPAAADDRARGDQQPQSLAAGFRYHAAQGREQGPVRPVQLRTPRLVAQQDSRLGALIKRAPVCARRWRSPGRPALGRCHGGGRLRNSRTVSQNAWGSSEKPKCPAARISTSRAPGIAAARIRLPAGGHTQS